MIPNRLKFANERDAFLITKGRDSSAGWRQARHQFDRGVARSHSLTKVFWVGDRATKADRQVIAALQSQLVRHEILLTNLRITDSSDGDVEIDVIVLFPDLGAAVLEIKGGHVQYDNGEWSTNRGTYSRRIHPVEQARRGKHALRRYLDRQTEWNAPLLRSQWFVAMPQTDVTGDMGPEGRRENLIGRGDLAQIRHQLRRELASTLNTDSMPAPGWQHDALTLLIRAGATQPPRMHALKTWVIPAAAGAAVVALLGAAWGFAQSSRAPVPALPTQPAPTVIPTGECHPNYEPCLPIVDDLDCPDIRMAVQVTGNDPYRLDRDGNGIGCESYL